MLRRNHHPSILLLLLALPLWVAVLWDARDAVQPLVPWLDEKVSLRRAASMRNGQIFDLEGGWLQPPGYPALLALLQAEAPPDHGVFESAPLMRPWQLAQIAAWAGILACLLASGRRLIGPGGGWIPALFFVLFADGWMLALRPLPEIWLALAAAVTLWGSLRPEASRRTLLWIGLVAGTASLFRGQAFLLVFPALIPLIRRRSWPRLAVLLLGTALPLASTSAIHSVKQGELSGPSSNAGINLYIGNRAGANGLYDIGTSYDFASDPAGRSWLGALGGRSDGTLAQVDHEWRRLALEEMRSSPASTLALWLRKAWLQVAAIEIPQIDGIDAWRRFVPTLSLFFLPFGVLSALALASLAWSRSSETIRLVAIGWLLLLAAQSFFFVTGRFRMVFLPHLCLLASVAVSRGLGDVRARRPARVLGVVLIAALLVIPWGLSGIRDSLGSGVDTNLGFRWSQLVAARFAAGDSEAALLELERWVGEHDTIALDERSGVLFLKLLSEDLRHDEAISHADELQRRFPESPHIAHAWALSHIRAGRLSEANRFLEDARQRWPQNEAIRSLWRKLREDLDAGG